MHKYFKQGFTLVELIVVITILAILGTIAFISLQGYSANARDSKRISDVNSIKTSLGLFFVHSGKYPLPDSGVEYSFSGELLWTQGFVGETVIKNLSRNIQEIPLDPSMDTQYIYSVANSQTQYEILANYELDNISNINLNNGVYAANFTPKITGTYNQIYVKTPNYIIPSPSIINALNQTTDFNTNNQAIQSQVISLGENNIANGKISSSTGALTDFVLTYTGAINSKSSDADKISVINTLQQAYSGTRFASNSEISYILSKTTDENKKDLAEQIILNSGVVSGTTAQDQDTPIDYCTTINPALVSYWKFDFPYDDDFSETTLNTQRWGTWLSGSGTASINISEQKLLTSSVAGVTSIGGISSEGKWKLNGDFDLQIDYEITSAWNKPSILDKVVGLSVFDSTNSWVITRQYNTAGENLYATWTNLGGTINKVSTTALSGKFRLERIGNTLNSYYYNSGWVQLSTYTFGSSDLTLRIFTNNKTTGDAISAKWDNFIINKGEILEDTKNINDGKIYGSTWTTGKLGKAISFDGVDDYVTIPDSSSLDLTNQISLSAWVKPNVALPSENKYIVGKFKYSDNNRSYLLYQGTDGKVYLLFSSDGTTATNIGVGSLSTLSVGTRTHIVGTYDGTKMKIYINGQLSNQRDYTGTIFSGSSPLRIAASGETTPSYLNNSVVDDVTIFNKGLSQEEVTKIYNDGIAGNSVCGN